MALECYNMPIMPAEPSQGPTQAEVEGYIHSLDPRGAEFAQIFGIMAQSVATLRNEAGRVPYEVFLASLELTGVYPCIEVIVTDKEGNLYLKRRSDDQNASDAESEAWGGRLHFPGSTVFPSKRFEMNFYGLLDREVVGGAEGKERSMEIARLYRGSEAVGIGLYPEPERKTDALTVFMRVEVEDPTMLQEGFEQVSEDNLGEVIDQHKPTIQRLLRAEDIGGPLLFDSRGR